MIELLKIQFTHFFFFGNIYIFGEDILLFLELS